MIAKALARYIRIAPKKMQPLTGIARGKRVSDALFALANTNKKGARILKIVVESALANAKHKPDKKYTEDGLYISRLTVDQGPALKRFRSMSMGRAGMIRKRTSHIVVELDVLPGAAPQKKDGLKAKKEKAPSKRPARQGV